ncbi:uncharacterized protein CCOS01_02265, partial [Colletotrichum costaricense]
EELETSGQNADGLRVDWRGPRLPRAGAKVPDLTEAVKAKADGREAAEWRLLRTGDSRPGILHSLHCAGTGTGTGTGTALGTGNAVSSKQVIGVIDKYCQVIIAALLCVAVEWVVSLLLREKKTNTTGRGRRVGGVSEVSVSGPVESFQVPTPYKCTDTKLLSTTVRRARYHVQHDLEEQ